MLISDLCQSQTLHLAWVHLPGCLLIVTFRTDFFTRLNIKWQRQTRDILKIKHILRYMWPCLKLCRNQHELFSAHLNGEPLLSSDIQLTQHRLHNYIQEMTYIRNATTALENFGCFRKETKKKKMHSVSNVFIRDTNF